MAQPQPNNPRSRTARAQGALRTAQPAAAPPAAPAPPAGIAAWGKSRMHAQEEKDREANRREMGVIEAVLLRQPRAEACRELVGMVRRREVGLGKALPAGVILQSCSLIDACHEEMTQRTVASVTCTAVRRSLFAAYCSDIASCLACDYDADNTMLGLPLSVCTQVCSFLPPPDLVTTRSLCRSLYIGATEAISLRRIPCKIYITDDLAPGCAPAGPGVRPSLTTASSLLTPKYSAVPVGEALEHLLLFLYGAPEMEEFANRIAGALGGGGGGASGGSFYFDTSAALGAGREKAGAAEGPTPTPPASAAFVFPAQPGLSVVLPLATILILRLRSACRGSPRHTPATSVLRRNVLKRLHEIESRWVEVVLEVWRTRAVAFERGAKSHGVFRQPQVDVLESLICLLRSDAALRSLRGCNPEGHHSSAESQRGNTHHDWRADSSQTHCSAGTASTPLQSPSHPENSACSAPTAADLLSSADPPPPSDCFPTRCLRGLLSGALPIVESLFRSDVLLDDSDAEFVAEARRDIFGWCCALGLTEALERIFQIAPWRRAIESDPATWFACVPCEDEPPEDEWGASRPAEGSGGGPRWNGLLSVAATQGCPEVASHLLRLEKACPGALCLGTPDGHGCLPLHYLLREGAAEATLAMLPLLSPLLAAQHLLQKTRCKPPPILTLLDAVRAGWPRGGGGEAVVLSSPSGRLLQALCSADLVVGALPLYWCLDALHRVPKAHRVCVVAMFGVLTAAGCRPAGLGTGVVPQHLPESLGAIAGACTPHSCLLYHPDSELGQAHCMVLTEMEGLAAEVARLGDAEDSLSDASVPDDWEADA